MRTLSLLVGSLLLVLGGCAEMPLIGGKPAGPPADVVVSPTGSDANPGTPDAPVATLAAAQQRVRKIFAAQPTRKHAIVVEVRGGTYELTRPLVLGPDDSGTEQAPVIWQAAAGEHPVISGGVRLTGWRVSEDGRWHLSLADVKSGKWSFVQLWVNDQRRFRPRLPRQGHYKIAGHADPTEKSPGWDRFVYRDGEIDPHWSNLGDVELLITHAWSMTRCGIKSVDAGSHTVTLAGHTGNRAKWRELKPGRPWFIENVKEALGEPGSWYLDRPTGELTYVPMPGEKPGSTTVVAPRIEELVVFAGASDRKPVEHITFRGLTFAHTNWTTPPGGQHASQAEVNIPGAVQLYGARHITLDHCAVRNIGNYAVEMLNGSQDNTLSSCELVDLGAGGVKIGQATRPHSPALGGAAVQNLSGPITGNAVRDCTIAHGGRLHPAAVGVWIGHADHTDIEHNDIFDLYYTGVSVGWVWGYAPSPAHHNRIVANHIHTIGQNVLSDMGGVYTLGISPGTVVNDNVIHDVSALEYGGWGLYTDEGSTDIQMAGNLVYRTTHGGFHQHYGRDNHIENNVFIDGRDQQLQRTRVEEHNSFFFQRNVVYWTTRAPLVKGNFHDHLTTDHNLYWNTAEPVKFPDGLSLEQWQQKYHAEQGSIGADPLFVSATGGDYHLRPESPAITKLGLVPLKSDAAGRLTKPTLTADLPPVPAGFHE